MKVIFVAAGSGGHINPALAIANMIKKNNNCEILFIGTKTGLENELVKNAGYSIKHISTGKLLRSFTFKNVKAIFNTYKGISDARKILKEFEPDLVIGTGGYICGPVMLACKELKVKYILHESNAFPGLSVKLLAKKAYKVLIGFEDARKRLKNRNNIIYTGNPTKFNISNYDKLDKEKSKIEYGLGNIDKKIVLVTCGSQGAKMINKTVIEMVNKYKSDKYFVVLVTGHNTFNEMSLKLKQIEEEDSLDLSSYIKLEKFVYDMDIMYNLSDLCITRSGAMTITELAICAKPSILIPLPTAAENHQYYNAKVLENVNAAKIIEQKDLNEEYLQKTIIELLDEKLSRKMSEMARSVAVENVENNILNAIF